MDRPPFKRYSNGMIENERTKERKIIQITVFFILVSFFFSGVSALIYEVIWTRLLGLVFGVSAFAVSTVLAAYMAGLALGAFCFGRLVDRNRKPARVYGWLEVGIGLFALLVPVLFSLTENVHVYIFREFSPPGYLSNVIRFMLSFLVLIVPTTLIGGTFPVISRMFAKKSEKIGADTGRLYSINTFGAVIGCFLAGFFLIRVIGVNGCAWLAAAINLIIGIVILRFIPAEEANREAPEGMYEDRGREYPRLPCHVVCDYGFIWVDGGYVVLLGLVMDCDTALGPIFHIGSQIAYGGGGLKRLN